MLDPQVLLMWTTNLLNLPKVFWLGKIKNGVLHGWDQTASKDLLVLDGVEKPLINNTLSKFNTMLKNMRKEKLHQDSMVFLFGLGMELPSNSQMEQLAKDGLELVKMFLLEEAWACQSKTISVLLGARKWTSMSGSEEIKKQLNTNAVLELNLNSENLLF